MGITIDLEKILVAGLGGELLGVDNGLLEGIALGGRHLDGLFGWGGVLGRWYYFL